VGVRIVRTAQASWSGTVPDGGGRLALGSGAFEGPYTLHGRVEEGQHTANPEELIGLADAACYTMSLADLLGSEGHPPKELTTDARVHLEQGESNWSITRIELHTVGKVDGVDAAEFERARAAGQGDLPGVARARGNGDHGGRRTGVEAARVVAKSDTVART
jgi:osmotically inducible protein OsmC